MLHKTALCLSSLSKYQNFHWHTWRLNMSEGIRESLSKCHQYFFMYIHAIHFKRQREAANNVRYFFELNEVMKNFNLLTEKTEIKEKFTELFWWVEARGESLGKSKFLTNVYCFWVWRKLSTKNRNFRRITKVFDGSWKLLMKNRNF